MSRSRQSLAFGKVRANPKERLFPFSQGNCHLLTPASIGKMAWARPKELVEKTLDITIMKLLHHQTLTALALIILHRMHPRFQAIYLLFFCATFHLIHPSLSSSLDALDMVAYSIDTLGF